MLFPRLPLARLGRQLRAVRADRLYLNSAALVINTGVNAAFGLVFWTVAARHFPASDIGVVTATTSLGVLLGTIGCLGLPNALIRYFLRSGRASRTFLWLSLVVTQVVTMVITCAVAMTSLAPPAVHALPGGFIAVVLFMQATAASMIVDASLMAVRHAEFIALKNTVTGIGRVAALFLVLGPGTQVEILLWIQTATSAAGAVIAAVILLVRLVPSVASSAAPQLKGLVHYSGSNLVAMSLGILPTAATPALVLRFGDAAAAAYFSFCVMLIGLLNIFASSISQSMFTEAQYGRHALQLLRQAGRSLAVVLLPAVAIFVLLAPIALWMFGDDYRENAALALRVMALGCVPAGLSYLIDACVNGRGDGRGYLLLNLQNSALVLVLVVVGVHTHGINGAAAGWTAAQLLSVVISAWYLRWSTKPAIPRAPATPSSARRDGADDVPSDHPRTPSADRDPQSAVPPPANSTSSQ